MPNAAGLRTLRPSWRARHGWMTGRTTKIGPDEFIGALALECRAIDARVQTTIRQSTPRNRIDFPMLHLPSRDLQVGAWCRSHGGIGDCSIVINPGVIMAIDDLALAVTSLPRFLVPDRTALNLPPDGPGARSSIPFEAAGHALAHPDRFWDYEAGMSGKGVDPDAITFNMPLDAWRLHQASVVAELAIAWVLLHEYSHWALAHLALLPAAARHIGLAEHAQPRVPEFRARPGRPPLLWPNVLISQTLEILADSSAFLLLVSYTGSARGPAARFNHAIARDTRRLHPQVMAKIDGFQTMRLCLTSAALACIVLDGYRRGDHANEDTHPSPSARFMNMESQSPAAWPGLLEPRDGAHVVVGGDEGTEFSVRRLAEAIAMASADADLIAALAASARNRPDHFSQHDPRTWSEQGWRSDMRRQWRTGAEDTGIDTPAGRELDRLLTDEPALIAELLYIQNEQFGRAFNIRL